MKRFLNLSAKEQKYLQRYFLISCTLCILLVVVDLQFDPQGQLWLIFIIAVTANILLAVTCGSIFIIYFSDNKGNKKERTWEGILPPGEEFIMLEKNPYIPYSDKSEKFNETFCMGWLKGKYYVLHKLLDYMKTEEVSIEEFRSFFDNIDQ